MNIRIIATFISIGLSVGAVGVAAGLPEVSSAWLTSVAASARTGYDDNVFLQDPSPRVALNGTPDRAGSWVGSVSIALCATWKPNPAFAFDAGYSPELTRYERFNSENHDDHRFTTGLRGQNDTWSYDFRAFQIEL